VEILILKEARDTMQHTTTMRRLIAPFLVATLLAACAGTDQSAEPAGSEVSSPAAATEEPTPGQATDEPAPSGETAYDPTPLSPTVPVRVGILRVPGPLQVAVERGYFEAEGLDVEIEILASGSDLLPLLASGQLDVGLSSPGAALFNAIASGVDLRLVADGARYRPGYGSGAVVVRSDLYESGEISEVADLEGRPFGVTAPGVSTYMMAVRLLEDAGLSEDDVSLETMAYPDMLPALASGQIDAANLTEPFITLGQSQGVLTRWIGHDELFPNQQQAVLTYSAPFADEQTEAAVRFMAAWLRAVRDWHAAFVAEDPDPELRDELISIISNEVGLEPDVVAEMVPIWLHPNGEVNADDLEAQQEWYHEHGLIGTPADIATVVDMSFAQAAVERIGEVPVD
jgi:NitT/TauT family transport system substrate-binding protein